MIVSHVLREKLAKNAVSLRCPQAVLFKIQNYTNSSDGRKRSVFLVLTCLYFHIFLSSENGLIMEFMARSRLLCKEAN